MTDQPQVSGAPFDIGVPDVVMFLIELAMWGSFAWIGWQVGSGVTRWVFALVFMLAAILIWAVFRTPGSPPGKSAIFPTPGPVRLILEFGLFLLAGLGLWATGYRWVAETLWTFTVLNYILSFSHIRWLLDH